MSILLVLLVFGYSASADTTISMGEYSLATEAGWGAAFEIKKDGTAIITPTFDYEGDDEIEEATGVRPKLKTISGKWKESIAGIELDYENHKDIFKYEVKCKTKQWSDYPCFQFVKSLADKKMEAYSIINNPTCNGGRSDMAINGIRKNVKVSVKKCRKTELLKKA